MPDVFSLANYGTTAHHVTQDELPTPEAVFITHQDVDHVDLGALALLPASVPIYVPEAEADKPWVDQLRRLVEDCGATVLYPYARGNLPWYRVAAGPLHEGQVGSHSLAAFDHFTELAKGVGARVVRLRHGELYTP